MCTSRIICFRACISIISSRPHPGAHLLILHMKRVPMTRLINHHSKHTCWWEYVVASDGPIRRTMQLGKRPGRIVSWEQAGRSWLVGRLSLFCEAYMNHIYWHSGCRVSFTKGWFVMHGHNNMSMHLRQELPSRHCSMHCNLGLGRSHAENAYR